MDVTFYEWLMRFRIKNTPTGKLARNMNCDNKAYKLPNSFSVYKKQIKHWKNYDECLVKSLGVAWKSYIRYVRVHAKKDNNNDKEKCNDSDSDSDSDSDNLYVENG